MQLTGMLTIEPNTKACVQQLAISGFWSVSLATAAQQLLCIARVTKSYQKSAPAATKSVRVLAIHYSFRMEAKSASHRL